MKFRNFRGTKSVRFHYKKEMKEREDLERKKIGNAISREQYLKAKLETLVEILEEVIIEARRHWPGATFLATEGGLSVVFGQEYERPIEVLFVPVFGLETGGVKRKLRMAEIPQWFKKRTMVDLEEEQEREWIGDTS